METRILEVYHGGTDEITNPIVGYGRQDLDFGPGFYVTDIYTQAELWAINKGAVREKVPVVNVYHLNKAGCLHEGRGRIFAEYDASWLEFVKDCRTGKKPWADYDYIEGGVADDRVYDTIRLYLQGFYDTETALAQLRFFKPNNQICLLNQELLERHLKFISSYNPQYNA